MMWTGRTTRVCACVLVGRYSIVGMGTRKELEVTVSNPGWGAILRASPDRSWGTVSLLFNAYRVILGGKAAGSLR